MFAPGGTPPNRPQKPLSRWLARPRKRHYTFARRLSDRFAGGPGSARRHRCLKALICRKFATKAKWQCRGRTVVAGLLFAPFVYRLGRHPFTVERAVRFR
jgi:hypothetical protein